MNIFCISTTSNISVDEIKNGPLSGIGNVKIIARYSNDQFQTAFPLTHVTKEATADSNAVTIKLQHITACEQIINLNVSGAIVVLDTVNLDVNFARNIESNRPTDSDICIFSPPNLGLNGVWINNSDWVLIDSYDRNRNNICNAYYITLAGAKKLFARRNEILNSNSTFGDYINNSSHNLANDRLITYMSFMNTSSKPSRI